MQRALSGSLENRQQAKDQRGCKADSHAAENNLEVQLEEDVEAKVLHQAADDITHTCRGGGSDYPTDQSKQTGLQTKEQVEISASIAGPLEHGNLGLAPREPDLHPNDNAHPADQTPEPASNLHAVVDQG